ncbi:MAG TPA: transglutaminase, partial [Afipia sp.]|nr:transglutaminase [Afipia sp.]
MLIRVGFEISYGAVAETPMVIMMRIHPSRARDIVGEETIITEPNVRIRYYHDSFGN